MGDRLKTISRLIADSDFRAAYIRAKLEVLIPSQLRALRLRQGVTQPELAQLAEMKQSRISAMETPGRVNFNLETLVRMAATMGVGLMVKFVPFSEMLDWENEYSQDAFDVTRLPNDIRFLEPAAITFLEPAASTARRRGRRKQRSAKVVFGPRTSQVPIASGGGANSVQMCLPFEPPQPLAQEKVANVIALPNRSRFSSDEPVFLESAAAAAGARRSYGN